MATIRMPVDGENFFQFVKGVPGENPELSYFPTYAHLIASAAAIGLNQDDPIDTVEFVQKQPNPIALDIFRNQGLFDILLLLSISRTKDTKVARNPELVSQIIEGLACAGFRAMHEMYDEGGIHFWLDGWEDRIVEQVGELGLE
jgi:hypothetical protein